MVSINVEHITFPSELKKKLTTRINKPIKTQFFGGANITTEKFNLALVEPFKVVFTRSNKHVIVFIIPKEIERTTAYEFFIGGIEKEYKCSMTSVINFVNDNL